LLKSRKLKSRNGTYLVSDKEAILPKHFQDCDRPMTWLTRITARGSRPRPRLAPLLLTATLVSLSCPLGRYDWATSDSALAAAPAPAKADKATPIDRFAPNPLLNAPERDPREGDRATPRIPPSLLTGAAKAAQQGTINSLNQQAQTRLQAGDSVAAFALWNQALQLTQALGPVEETKALAQVGLAAWERNQTQQVRYISQRLQQLQQEHIPSSASSASSNNTDRTLLTELAVAYQSIRAPELAIGVYRHRLTQARQQRDNLAEFQTMNAIGQTHLDWFGYTQAVKVYQELLDQAQSQNDAINQMAYAYQLAYVHSQMKNPTGAIGALETLIPLYAKTPEPTLLADLQIRLADQYQANQQPQLAEASYQSAYRSAETLLQQGFAGDALRRLGKFYRAQNRPDAAIQVYDFLSTFEQTQTLNVYNAMDAYDQLGQVYLDQNALPQATNAFQQGLNLAQTMNYRQDYFRDRLTQLTNPVKP
jgi:tetratricopeptide (TPR) repeat protein